MGAKATKALCYDSGGGGAVFRTAFVDLSSSFSK